MLSSALILCTLCAPQLATKPTQMSPEFSKSALRALLAINSESRSIANGFIHDSKVEAQSPTELKAVDDLWTIQLVIGTMRTPESVREGELANTEAIDHDPKLQALYKQDSECRKQTEAMFRSRVYSRLSSACTQSLCKKTRPLSKNRSYNASIIVRQVDP
jgi:hypothetical protein